MPEQENKIEQIKIEENKFVSIDDFLKIEIKIGTIINVEVVESSDKLYKLSVDFGEEGEIESEGGITEKEKHIRTVFSGIRKYVTVEGLVGKQYPFVTNLKPRKIMGEYSEAMILAASDDENFSLLSINTEMKNGVRVG
jgi:methionyl-tRNA synthetase